MAGYGSGMADETLIRLRETAAAYASAVRETQRYFDRIDDTNDPSVLIEYANLVRVEEAAARDRLDALADAGIRVGSIDDDGE